ncbi:glycosyltransferase family 2 protein [Spongiimicrobium salis]|uniref:glycosyltransferase family 2 protein n=1 Tax=Spongiimicrobium salis TaxID=1667022 RepID=UPI00374C9AF3
MTTTDHAPLVSIITITYNSEATLTDTFESLLQQTYKNFECIIVDGKSSDSTLSIVKSYSEKLTERGISYQFISEKDKGIADAWNKGLKLAKGSIIGMLNSDDWYDDNAIANAVACLDDTALELSYGICKRVDENKELIEVMDVVFNPNRIYLNFGFSYTTCFMTRKVIDEIGGFNLDYKIAIDTDFLLRAFKKKVLFKKCNNITYMRLGGVSTKFEKAALLEHQTALKNNGFNTLLIWIFGVIKKSYLYLKK